VLNKVLLIGRLSGDPVIKFLPSEANPRQVDGSGREELQPGKNSG